MNPGGLCYAHYALALFVMLVESFRVTMHVSQPTIDMTDAVSITTTTYVFSKDIGPNELIAGVLRYSRGFDFPRC